MVHALFGILGHFQVELGVFVLGYITGCWLALTVARN
jgi:hypothetical protein